MRKWAWKTRKYILRNLFQKIICTIVVVQTFVTNAVWPPMKNSNSYEPLQWKLWSLFEVMTCPMLTFFSSLGGVVPCVCLQWGYSSLPNRGVGNFIKFDEKNLRFSLCMNFFFTLFINACMFIWSCTSTWYTRVDGFALIFLESLKLLNCMLPMVVFTW